PPDLTPEESAVYLLLSEEPAHIDAMHGHGLSQAALSATLTMLEMKGLIKSLPGKRFCRG
ncbi:MAG: DNA-protecting protein DprA, partial [Clostridia bacterium]|nr:DNA-protecting protein DprA [Clostridia bacterium]